MVTADFFTPSPNGAFQREQDRQHLLRLAEVAHQCEELLQDFIAEFEQASAAVRENRQLAARAVALEPALLEACSLAVRNDPEVARSAVASDGVALQHLSEDSRGDRALVLTAVQSNGFALEYASRELQEDFEVVLEAVRTDGQALQFAGEKLRDDKAIVLAAVESAPEAIQYAAKGLRSDEDILTAALQEQRYQDACWADEASDSDGEEEEEDDAAEARAEARAEMAAAKLADESESWQQVHQAAGSALALRGEVAPIVTVSLAPKPSRSSDRDADDDCVEVEATLLSGHSFTVRVAHSDERRSSPIVNDLALGILKELSLHSEVKAAERIFLLFTDDDDETNVASVWDWNRPLTEIL